MSITAPLAADHTEPAPRVAAEARALAAWPVITELSSDAAQQVFHDMMEAMSRPGTFKHLGANTPEQPVPAAIVPLLTLVDLMTPLAALPSEADISSAENATTPAAVAMLSRLTGAPVSQPEQARYALALGEPTDFARLNQGSHWSPEQGATLVQRVAEMRAAEDPELTSATLRVRLTGPGIHPDSPTTVGISGLSLQWFETRAQLTSSYPAGVDCVLITDEGAFICIPRTTKIEVL